MNGNIAPVKVCSTFRRSHQPRPPGGYLATAHHHNAHSAYRSTVGVGGLEVDGREGAIHDPPDAPMSVPRCFHRFDSLLSDLGACPANYSEAWQGLTDWRNDPKVDILTFQCFTYIDVHTGCKPDPSHGEMKFTPRLSSEPANACRAPLRATWHWCTHQCRINVADGYRWIR